MARTKIATAFLLMWLASSAHGDTPSRFDDVVSAARLGDPSQLDLAAKRAGARRVRDSLRADARPYPALLAAALPTWETADAWLLLAATSELSSSHDRPIAVAAARATRTLAETIRDQPPSSDVPASAIALTQERCLRTAQRGEIWADVRVLNLECAVALSQALSNGASLPALSLTGDDDAQVRLAAASLLTPPASDEVRETLLMLLRTDPDQDVAAAAAASLCLDEKPQLSDEDHARIRRLLRVPTLDPGAVSILRGFCPAQAGR